MSIFLNAANVLVSILGVAAADTVLGGMGTAISGGISLQDVFGKLPKQPTDIAERIARDLGAALQQTHLSADDKRLIPQMIERCTMTPEQVASAHRDPAHICKLMLAAQTDPAHTAPLLQDAFTRVLTPIFKRLFADTQVCDTLRPAFEQVLAQAVAEIAQKVDFLYEQAKRDAPPSLSDVYLLNLAHEFAHGSHTDIDTAYRGLRAALAAAERIIARGEMPRNLGDQITATFAEIARLNNAGLAD